MVASYCQVEMSNGGKGGRFGRSRSRSPVRRRSPARRSRFGTFFSPYILHSCLPLTSKKSFSRMNKFLFQIPLACRSRSRRRRSPSYRSMSRGRCGLNAGFGQNCSYESRLTIFTGGAGAGAEALSRRGGIQGAAAGAISACTPLEETS